MAKRTFYDTPITALAESNLKRDRYVEQVVPYEAITTPHQNPSLGKKVTLLDFERQIKIDGQVIDILETGDFKVFLNLKTVQELEDKTFEKYIQKHSHGLTRDVSVYGAIAISILVIIITLMGSQWLLQMWNAIIQGDTYLFNDTAHAKTGINHIAITSTGIIGSFIIIAPIIITALIRTHWFVETRMIEGLVATALACWSAYMSFQYLVVFFYVFHIDATIKELWGTFDEKTLDGFFEHIGITGGILYMVFIMIHSLEAYSHAKERLEAEEARH